MVNEDGLMKQIRDTRYEVFPLDRMLPKETVLSIFLDVYNAADNKAELMKNSPATKRIREAYWSLFACVTLDIVEQADHLMFFPLDDRNDISFLSANDLQATRPKMNFMEFDVKEYNQYSAKEGFGAFIAKTINPARSTYGIIVGVHEDIGVLNASSLYFGESDRGVLLVVTDSSDDSDILKARVIFVLENKVILDRIINLAEHIGMTDMTTVFQDKLRGLPR